MTYTRLIGIDPGKTGGIALLVANHEPSFVVETVTNLDGHGMADAVKRLVGTEVADCFVVIEKAQAMPKQGVVSMFNYGVNFGTWQGIVAALGVDHALVTPQQWKRVVLEGTARDKEAALDYVQRRFRATLKKTEHGMADALCIAEYARRTYGSLTPGDTIP